MVSSPVSASNGQFPYAPSEISGLGADTSMLDPAFTHFANLERFSNGTDGGKLSGQAPWNFGLVDTAGWPNLPGKNRHGHGKTVQYTELEFLIGFRCEAIVCLLTVSSFIDGFLFSLTS